ncbi:MAG: hypothetical protein F6K36_21845 [Symploca sp. SIO3C6]|nr:hypothetical protein [Symploca sp. SIO3C6]
MNHKTAQRRKKIWQRAKKILNSVLTRLKLLVRSLLALALLCQSLSASVLNKVSLFALRLVQSIKWVFLGFISLLRKAKIRDPILAVILVLVWITILFSNFVFQGRYVFEGNLVVQEMSFTYTGLTNKRFLNNISGIQNLDIEGSQPEPLILTGKFSSDSNPELNQKLSQIKQLTIELPYPTSRLIFSHDNSSQASDISILNLRINPEVKINQLAYNAKKLELSFCLQSVQEPLEDCLFPDSLLDNPTPSKPTKVGDLKLQLGKRRLRVSLAMFNLPELGIKTDIYAPEDLTFGFIPEIDDPQVEILSPTHLLIDLPKPTKTKNSATDKQSQWFWREIDVKNVGFSRFEMTENVTDELKTSTILKGKVRMKEKKMELEENQFLLIESDKPGITKLHQIQINTQSPEGLRTRFSGKSKGIAVGLDPKFPVESIEPSWLSKYLSQEAVNALLAFIAALTAVLLPRLFPEPPKKP